MASSSTVDARRVAVDFDGVLVARSAPDSHGPITPDPLPGCQRRGIAAAWQRWLGCQLQRLQAYSGYTIVYLSKNLFQRD